MRLYLSSFRLGDHRHRLVELAGGGRRVALVGNALDAETDDVRQAGLAREVNELTSLGFTVTEADLRNESDATEQLLAADVIWVRGGNVFVLRRALADSGLRNSGTVVSGENDLACRFDGRLPLSAVTAVAESPMLGVSLLR